MVIDGQELAQLADVASVGDEGGVLRELPSVHIKDETLNDFEVDKVIVIEILVIQEFLSYRDPVLVLE
jgi:hypothetical protein